MQNENNPLESNHDFIEGRRKGEIIVRNIAFTTYKTLEGALITKQTLRDMLKSQLGFDESNREYAETLGIIDSLEKAIENQN